MQARAADSLKAKAGDALKGFFGSFGKKKTESPPPSSQTASDTTKSNP